MTIRAIVIAAAVAFGTISSVLGATNVSLTSSDVVVFYGQ